MFKFDVCPPVRELEEAFTRGRLVPEPLLRVLVVTAMCSSWFSEFEVTCDWIERVAALDLERQRDWQRPYLLFLLGDTTVGAASVLTTPLQRKLVAAASDFVKECGAGAAEDLSTPPDLLDCLAAMRGELGPRPKADSKDDPDLRLWLRRDAAFSLIEVACQAKFDLRTASVHFSLLHDGRKSRPHYPRQVAAQELYAILKYVT